MKLSRYALIACCLSISPIASNAILPSGIQKLARPYFDSLAVAFLSNYFNNHLNNLWNMARFGTIPAGRYLSSDSPVHRAFQENQELLRMHGLGSNSNEEEDSAHHDDHQFTDGSPGSPASAQDENQQRMREFPDTSKDKS